MRKYFNTIMDIGEQMLVCGAEVHRVEDSIERMCSAIGFIKTDVFIITSSMVVTVYTTEDNYTQTRRIKGIGMDIERLHRLNALSRKICEQDLSEHDISSELNKIKLLKRSPLRLECLSYMLISGSFTLFFGGNFIESIASALIGSAICIINHFSEKAFLNKIFAKFIGAFAVTLGAYILMELGVIHIMDKVIIGNIMLLIPGVGLTNALRDLLVGDNIAGLIRLIEAVLLALAIAAGYFLFVFLMGGKLI